MVHTKANKEDTTKIIIKCLGYLPNHYTLEGLVVILCGKMFFCILGILVQVLGSMTILQHCLVSLMLQVIVVPLWQGALKW